MSKNIFKILLLFLTLVLFACEKKEDKVSENIESTQTKFPTYAKAEYVMACMTSNQNTPEYLHKCSCSVDYIESQYPNYNDYVNAETLMGLRQIEGEKSWLFKTTPNAKEIFTKLQNTLAEAEMECF